MAGATTAVTPKMVGRVDPGVLQRAGAEGGDAVADLVEGDDAAGDGGRHRDQLLLAEADRQRQQRRAAEAGERRRPTTPSAGCAAGQRAR